MALLAELGINLGDIDAQAAEDLALSGGLCPPGLQHAALVGCAAQTIESTGTKLKRLTFKVLAGPGKGCEVRKDLFLPNDNQEPDKREKTEGIVLLFAHRLGLIRRVKRGAKEVFEPVPGRDDFHDCFGVDVVIDVEHREYEGKKGKGQTAEVKYAGIMAADHPKAKDVRKGTKEEAKAAARTFGTAGLPKRPTADQYADL